MFLFDQKVSKIGENLTVEERFQSIYRNNMKCIDRFAPEEKIERSRKTAVHGLQTKSKTKQSNATCYTKNGFKIRVITIKNVTIHESSYEKHQKRKTRQ